MGGVGSAFGKLLLFGEHAAVHGHPALGASLPEMTVVRLDDGPGHEWNLDSIPTEDRGGVRAVLARMEALIPDLADRGYCSVRVESNVARGVGFGSSAALCGAFARAALAHARRGAEEPPDAAWQCAHEAERIFHGTPSGIDTGLSLRGGTWMLQPRLPSLPDCERLEHPRIWLVVGAVPRDAACGELIGAVSRRIASGDTAARACIEALGGLASAAVSVLRGLDGGTAKGIARLADAAMPFLRDLDLSTPALEKVLAAGGAAGALGGKLSGAGAGGAFYLVAENEASAGEIKARVQRDCRSIGFVSPVRVLVVGDAGL